MMRVAGVAVRDAHPTDAPALARLHHQARAAAMPGLAEPHDEDGVAQWLAAVLMARHTVRLAQVTGETAGYIGHGLDPAHGAMVFHLYLDPVWQRRGIGSMLLAEAMAAYPAGLTLFCFVRNTGARAFYERHGFRVAAFCDGTANEEGESDILYLRDADGPRTQPGNSDHDR